MLLSLVPLLGLVVIGLSHWIPRAELIAALARYLEWIVPGQSKPMVAELKTFLANRDVIGDDPDLRRWAMHMTLVARCLERIGDNAVDIGEQVAFVVTGLFREFSDASHPGK